MSRRMRLGMAATVLALSLGCGERTAPEVPARCARSGAPSEPRNADDRADAAIWAACVDVMVDGRIAGSGWFSDEAGHVVTAEHITPTSDTAVSIRTHAGQIIDATVERKWTSFDVALLKASSFGGGCRSLSLAAAVPPVGGRVRLFGRGNFRPDIVLSGTVASDSDGFEYRPTIDDYKQERYATLVAFMGASGGPLVDDSGECVGILSGSIQQENAASGVAGFVSVDVIRDCLSGRCNDEVATLLSAFEVVQDVETRSEWGTGRSALNGVVPRHIRAAGPLDSAQIGPRDMIVAIEGKRIVEVRDLIQEVRKHRAGEVVVLSVVSAVGEVRDVRVRLAGVTARSTRK